MREEFIISDQVIKDADKVGRYYLKGDFFKKDEHYFFFKHSLYEIDKTMEEYLEEFLANHRLFVEKRKGDFALLYFNASNEKIYFASDRLGKENIFYSNTSKFVITNSFWDGISVLQPREEDINWLGVKAMIIHSVIPCHKTIVKGYEIVKPAQIAEVTEENELCKIKFETYWEMKYNPKETNISDTVDKIYYLFDHTFELLAQKYDENTKFGVGLSGGWDSRLIVHFAQKHHLKIVPYCIGEKYLFFPIKTNGYRVAKRLADYFNLKNFVFVPYDSETYLKKAAREVAMIPNRASNIEIGCMSAIPDFDIMLDGEHGGVFFGEFDFEPVLKYTKENLAQYLLDLLASKAKQEMIINEDERKILKKEVQSYIDSLDTEKRFDIYYKYFFEIMGSKSKNGFFESIYLTKERYSMYLDPDFIDEYLTWDPLFLANRTLQREFFKKYFQELSKIPDETTDAPLYWRDMSIKNLPVRLMFAIKNFVFKSSLRRGLWLKRDKDFKKLLKRTIELNSDIIKRHFPDLDMKEFYSQNPRATANLVKMLMVIDALLNSEEENKEQYILAKYNS